MIEFSHFLAANIHTMTEDDEICGTHDNDDNYIPVRVEGNTDNRVFCTGYRDVNDEDQASLLALNFKLENHPELVKTVKDYILEEIRKYAVDKGHPSDNWKVTSIVINVFEKI